MENDKLIKLFNIEADCSSIRTDENENEYIERTMSCETFLFCVNQLFKKIPDEEVGKIVEKIAYSQLAEEQSDDFIEKVYLLREFLNAL